MFSEFCLAYYRFTLQAGERGLILPPFKGNLLLDHKIKVLLRRYCCITARRECISNCVGRSTCAYAFLFNKVEAGPLSYRNFAPLPPPLAWHPPLEKKTDYVPGEHLYFYLVLIGRGISFLDKLVTALQELGETGPSSGGNFILKSVQALCPFSGSEQLVYGEKDGQIAKTEVLISGAQVEAWAESHLPLKRLTILFLTPTCLRVGDEFLDKPLFPVLVRELFRRASALYYFFHGYKEMDLNYREFLHKAEKVRPIKDYTRFSAGRQRGGTYGEAEGLLGEVTYINLLPDFLPLLKLGEYLNLGRHAAFGLGRYRLKL
ncbi:MAG: CRISPR system precrRNA processing endoribonuclease RAMP protein Cas6 [Bacillota bacterium]